MPTPLFPLRGAMKILPGTPRGKLQEDTLKKLTTAIKSGIIAWLRKFLTRTCRTVENMASCSSRIYQVSQELQAPAFWWLNLTLPSWLNQILRCRFYITTMKRMNTPLAHSKSYFVMQFDSLHMLTANRCRPNYKISWWIVPKVFAQRMICPHFDRWCNKNESFI